MAKNQQQVVKTLVVLSGRVDNKFGAIGAALDEYGGRIDAIGAKIRAFGKENLEEYINYDDVMREVEALGEYDRKTMDALDAYNKTIAQTSRYTMEQAAQAEKLMAQLGLNVEEISTLTPTVMELATAANIELADSLDYLYYSLNALDLPMEYANTLADQMSKTAAISAADIDTLGMSLQRLGSGAQFFTGGSDEILAILAGISKFGSDMQGSNAGTQLRNFMLTLLAPTQGKQTLLEMLAISEQDWAEFESYMEDAEIDLTDTAAAMSELGFSAYDSAGNLKSAIQIISELKAALGGKGEAESNRLLGLLFGKRTTTTAKNLMATLDDIIAYQKEIEGSSTGYTGVMADIMDGGLGGAVRELDAAFSSLNVTLGDTLDEEAEWLVDGLTNIVTGIANMDPATLEMLAGGAVALGATGPALMTVGGALKLIGALATPGGAIAVGTMAIAALTGGIIAYNNAMRDMKLESTFGEMELDSEALLAYVNGIGDAFNDTYEDVNNYKSALDAAVDSYTEASASLSGELLTSMITGSTLTPEQISEIQSLGTTMGSSLQEGINASFAGGLNYLEMLFGGEGVAEQGPDYRRTIGVAEQMYGGLFAQAEAIGRELGETLGAAMDDGIVTGDEYQAILDKMNAYDDAMAFVAEADAAAQRAEQLHRARSVSWDSAEAFLAEQAAMMNANIEQAGITHAGERARWGVYYDEAIRRGDATEAEKAAFLADMDSRYAQKIQGYRSQNDEVAYAVFDALMSGSGHGEAWKLLQALYADGGMTPEMMEAYSYSADWSHIGTLLQTNGVSSANANQVSNMMADLWDDVFGRHGMDSAIDSMLEPFVDSAKMQLIPQMLDSANTIAYAAQEYFTENPLEPLVELPDGAAVGAQFAAEAQAALDMNPGTWRVKSAGGGGAFLTRYAEGGRATEASIFGEAGAEWAIPEEHTQRTANLLDAARAASGFTWPELIASSGGGSGTTRQLIYSPTIIANDANGVERKLIEDKERLERWYNDRQLRNDVEVYA